MSNVHRDYLLKRLREERDAAIRFILNEMGYAGQDTRAVQALTRSREYIANGFKEIEYQIERAFDDMAKEGGAP